MAWGKAGSTTLTTSGDSIDSGTITANKFNVIITNFLDTGGQCNTGLSFNGDTGNNYARRWSTDGASDTTQTSRANVNWHQSIINEGLGIVYLVNISSEEKLLITSSVVNGSTGAGNAPTRKEFVGKWANTSAQITQFTHTNTDTGSFDTDSNVSVLGSDGTESLNVQDGAIYHDTDLNKEYVLYNNTWTEI